MRLFIIKVYGFFPPDGAVREIPIEMPKGINKTDETITILNNLVKNGTLQGFLAIPDNKQEEGDKE